MEPSRAAASAEPVSRLGRYLVVGLVGVGGMGRVLRAYDPELRREVALKQLLARGSVAVARIVREARAMARLRHQNLVPVYDVGQDGDNFFIAMEFVDGTTLRGWLDESARPWRAVVEAFVGAGRGLAAAHGAGVVHRDFKPANVMVGGAGPRQAARENVRVVDFGLAEEVPSHELDVDARAERPGLDRAELTQPGVVLGTPLYMSPEQHFGGVVGPASDQFAFCVALYEALHHTRAFDGKDLHELASRKLRGVPNPPAVAAPGVPGWLQRAVLRGLSPDPAKRWPSMDDLVAELERGQARVRRRRLVAAGAAAGIVCGGIALALVLDRHQRTAACEQAGASIDEIWNHERRAQVRDALVGTAVSYAESTADKVAPWLDAHADAWHKARTEACLDATVRGQWDGLTFERSLWCLDERREALDALVGQLLHADEIIVQAAVGAAARLGRVDVCRNTLWLDRLPAPPRERREEVRAVRADLSRAEALDRAGKYSEGLALVRATLPRAESLGWRPGSVAARALEARLLDHDGQSEAAAAAGEAAYFDAAPLGEWEVAADAATQLVVVVGDRGHRPADGLAWGKHAQIALAHALDPEGLLEADRLSALASLHRVRGANELAQTLHEQALAIREQALGPDHPEVAGSLASLANVFRAVHDYPRARTLHERALAIREGALGPAHPEVASSLGNLGVVFAETGDHARARELFERALAIGEGAHGPHHVRLVGTLYNLAAACAATRDFSAARAHFERALAILEATHGPRDPSVAAALINVAKVHNSTGEQDRAIPLYERAIEIQRATLGPEDPEVAASLWGLARVYLTGGETTQAVRTLERAVAIYDRHDGEQAGELDARFALAKALITSSGDRAKAHALALQARDGWRAAGEGRAAELAAIEQWLRTEGDVTAAQQ